LVDNLLKGAPPPEGERFREVLRCRNLVIEQILSSGRPQDSEYCQAQDEWVVLIQGRARLDLAGTPLDLGPGDSLFIPAGTRHRVLTTSSEPHCIWVAVHLYP
jgi:cupin 2 domain-containing protein